MTPGPTGRGTGEAPQGPVEKPSGAIGRAGDQQRKDRGQQRECGQTETERAGGLGGVAQPFHAFEAFAGARAESGRRDSPSGDLVHRVGEVDAAVLPQRPIVGGHLQQHPHLLARVAGQREHRECQRESVGAHGQEMVAAADVRLLVGEDCAHLIMRQLRHRGAGDHDARASARQAVRCGDIVVEDRSPSDSGADRAVTASRSA